MELPPTIKLHWSTRTCCPNPSCNKRMMVTVEIIFLFDRNGRQRRGPAYPCQKCGRISPLSSYSLPIGVLPTIPGHKEWMEAKAGSLLDLQDKSVLNGRAVTGKSGFKLLSHALLRASTGGAVVASYRDSSVTVKTKICAALLQPKAVLQDLDRLGYTDLAILYLDAGRQRYLSAHKSAGLIAY